MPDQVSRLPPARWAVTGMAGAYSLALCAGCAVTAGVLSRRLAVSRPLRSGAAGPHARLLLAAVRTTVLGHLVARGTAPAGRHLPHSSARAPSSSPSPITE